MNKKHSLIFRKVVVVLLFLALAAEIIRDTFNKGDFAGYIIAGEFAVSGQDIYSHYLNTWPPFFSVFCVPLYWLNTLSPELLRFFWLAGSLLSFFIVMNITSVWFLKKKIQSNPFSKVDENSVSITETIILVPLIIAFRYVLDNLANVQINMYLLLLCVLSIYYFLKDKSWLSGILLSFVISLKVYPVFLFLFFLFKREFKVVAWTVIFMLFFNSLTLLVWDSAQALNYYAVWYQKFVVPYTNALYKNQSLFAFIRRLVTDSDTHFPLRMNIANLEIGNLKMLSYLVILLASVYPAWLFRKSFFEKNNIGTLLQFTFIFTAIPLLSPMSWKAYFIFLWPGYFSSFYLLFFSQYLLHEKNKLPVKILFFASVALTVLSTELIVGPYFSDVLEVYSAITIGTILLLFVQLLLYQQHDKSNSVGLQHGRKIQS